MNINDPKELAGYIDHTILKPDATFDEVGKICDEAKEYQFASVCINPYFVPFVRDALKGSPVRTCTVIGFPLGCTPMEVKGYEAARAIKDGAQEVDMVINISALKSGRYGDVEDDIKSVVNTAGKKAVVKVIFETCFLTDDEIKTACGIALKAGAGFVKTSTGFGKGGATVEAVRIMNQAVGGKMGIKASGGIKDYETAKLMVENGATRIGTSSGVKIVS
jgi:deoxyribose-phosphate aldolase